MTGTDNEIVDLLGRLDQVEVPGERLQEAAGSAIPHGGPLKDVLGGRGLGHPLHPLLTDLAIGAWTGAPLLDVLGGPSRRKPAVDLIGAGIVASVPTALSGLSDRSDMEGRARRIGLIHGLGNTPAEAPGTYPRRKDRGQVMAELSSSVLHRRDATAAEKGTR